MVMNGLSVDQLIGIIDISVWKRNIRKSEIKKEFIIIIRPNK